MILVSIVLIITFSERNESLFRCFCEFDLPDFLSFAPYIANLITINSIYSYCFCTSKLASHTEIIAILSGGVSYPRMQRPVGR